VQTGEKPGAKEQVAVIARKRTILTLPGFLRRRNRERGFVLPARTTFLVPYDQALSSFESYPGQFTALCWWASRINWLRLDEAQRSV